MAGPCATASDRARPHKGGEKLSLSKHNKNKKMHVMWYKECLARTLMGTFQGAAFKRSLLKIHNLKYKQNDHD